MNKLLHTPLTVHNVELANRLVMPPMATGKTPDGTVQDDLLAYYDARSKGGCIGLIVTEHAYISPEGKAHEGQLSVSRDTDIPGLTKLVETIHKNNTRVIAQINHAGSAAMEEITGYPAISASVTAQSGYARKSEKPVREMTADDMHTVAKKFAEAALRVKEAGFDGVEIHAAHGYLLDQFYSPLGNKRTDAYGGDLDGRIHLISDVIHAVREAVGEDYLVALRLGACDYTEGGATIDDAVYACKKFEEAGVDLLDISGGFNGFTVKSRKGPGFFSDASSAIREAVHVPVILTGGVTKANEAEALLEEGAADLIGVGRAIFKDADWAKKEMEE